MISATQKKLEDIQVDLDHLGLFMNSLQTSVSQTQNDQIEHDLHHLANRISAVHQDIYLATISHLPTAPKKSSGPDGTAHDPQNRG